ncbi:MAG: ParB N-terminal domain-containing protein [Thermoplasmata archaeon]
MTEAVRFALVPLDALRAHERVVPRKVTRLVAELRRSGVFVDPIWVARGTDVILNGHHRVAALRRLGAERVPAWVVDYDSDVVSLDRWTPGPPIPKAEVVRRARSGALFPPRTTRHTFSVELPARRTTLSELGTANGSLVRRPHARRAGAARASRAGSSPPG